MAVYVRTKVVLEAR
jgi:hypothetical protein